MADVLRLPRMSDTMEEGVIAELNIKVGDVLETGDVIAEVETDKATMEWESFQEGTVLYLEVKSGDTIPVNGIVAVIGEEGEDYKDVLESEKNNEKEEEREEDSAIETAKEDDTENVVEFEVDNENTEDESNSRIKASPLAKKIAEDKGIDLSKIEGSGDDGRIIKKDIENYSTPSSQSTKSDNIDSTKNIELPKIVAEESFEEIKVSQMRKTIAKRLSESKFQAPHFYLTIEVNFNETIKARKAMNEVAAEKISFNDLIIKATASALRKHPKINASWLGDKIRYNNHIHIGMAVAVEEGLVVPVIKFADNKSLTHIALESKEFVEKARNKKLQPEEMQGNTFSISNLGMMGISEFTAVINPPDACILAVGGIKKEVAFNENGELTENNVMKLTLSCDHRVVDGALGASFLKTLKEQLENPVRILV